MNMSPLTFEHLLPASDEIAQRIETDTVVILEPVVTQWYRDYLLAAPVLNFVHPRFHVIQELLKLCLVSLLLLLEFQSGSSIGNDDAAIFSIFKVMESLSLGVFER